MSEPRKAETAQPGAATPIGVLSPSQREEEQRALALFESALIVLDGTLTQLEAEREKYYAMRDEAFQKIQALRTQLGMTETVQ